MADARHPKPYPRGPKHEKLPVTPEWKARVVAAIENNKRLNRPPRTQAELARMIKADKGGLQKLLDGDQKSYKYARQISDLLGIGDAMVANPELTKDEWDIAVADMRKLSLERQRQALAILRTFAIDDE